MKFSEADKDGIREGDTLYIYDAATADDAAILGKVGYMEDEDDYARLSFVSTGKYLTFRFESVTTWGSDGWEALIMPVNLQADMDTAKVFIVVSSVPETAITMYSDTVCLGQTAEVSASADLEYPQYYIWYDNDMQELLRDTLHDASESPSVLSLPSHYADAFYYALIYSDTVSCVMNIDGLQKAYTELPITAGMSGLGTQLSPNDSIRVFTPTAINRTGSDNYNYDYYFTADEGVIQIHFDEIVMSGGHMEISDEEMDIEYADYSAGTYHDVTFTSLRNMMHLQFSRETGNTFSFDATVINIASSNAILSKMEQVDVTVKLSAVTANVITTNDTVCYGSPALLTASSLDPAFPQIYTWYNSDVSEVLLSDTINSGVSSLFIPGQLGNATYYVFMNNENNECPLAVVDNHDNFREYLFTEDRNNTTLFVGAVDSLVIYDDGGKDGNYNVVTDGVIHINILKLQTYSGSTIHVDVPTLDIDPEYSFFVFGEPDSNGNLDLEDESNLMMYAGQMSNISYNSQTNILYLGWVYFGTEDAEMKPGFEAVFTATMHPENQLTAVKAVMSPLPHMNTSALAVSPQTTTICQGDDLELTSTTSLTDYPQYFVWYNSDFTSVLASDTVLSGNEGHATIANLTQDTVVYAAVGTDEMCPAYPMDHKFNVQELYLTNVEQRV